LDSSQNATFNADVKISKASGSTTQSFVPATGQSSQIQFFQDDGSTQDARIFAPEGSTKLAFEAGTTEMMRMSSTGIGIGTALPDTNLHIFKADASATAHSDAQLAVENSGVAAINILSGETSHGQILFGDTGDANKGVVGYDQSTDIMYIRTSGNTTKYFIVNGSGNVGIGNSALETWKSGFTALQIGGSGSVVATTTQADGSILHLSNNAYYDNTNTRWEYMSTNADDEATNYYQQDGIHAFRTNNTAGSDDAAITWTTNMILDANSRISLSNNDAGSGGEDSTSGNTIFGYLAGAAIDSDVKNNTLFGHKAGTAINGGDWNVMVGEGAGKAVTDGHENVFVGQNAGTATTSVGFAVGIGQAAMGGANATSDADGSVAVGASALASLTSGIGNVAVGYQALDAEDDGDKSTALGHQALTAQTGVSGEVSNTAIGYSAGTAISTGIKNVIIGSNTALVATTVQNSVIIGQAACGDGNLVTSGTATDSADGLVAIGRLAGYAAISTAGTTLVGMDSGKALTTGNYNTAVGYNSLITEDTGSGNTAIGYQALKVCNNATGGNTSVGKDSLLLVTTGYSNTAVGIGAGSSLETGINNVFIGRNVQPSGTGATNQVVIGGVDTTGVADNSVTLGNSSVTRIAIPNASMIGSQAPVSMADDAVIKVIDAQAGAAMVYVYDSTSGGGGVFFVTYTDNAVKVAGSSNTAATDNDGNLCVYKSTSDHDVYVKNRLGATRSISITIVSALAA
jgi:hypothetical protein